MFTKDELKVFRKDFDSAVAVLGKKYNVQIELGAINYGDISFHAKMTCTKLTETGEIKVDVTAFGWMKELLGFNGNIGDKYTDHRGITYTIYNLDPKKPKFAVLLKGSDGKNYKSTVANINMMLARKTA